MTTTIRRDPPAHLPTHLSDNLPGDLPPLLAGSVRAQPRARAAAAAIDVIAVLVVVGLPLAPGAGQGDLALVAVGVATLTGTLVLGYHVSALTGRTLGRLALGLRAVDTFTGLPLGLGRTLADRWCGAVVLDVRAGRDPTLGAAPDVTSAAGPPTPTSARWVPAPPPVPPGAVR